MPQSLAFLLVHLVFSTKERAPILDASVRPPLYAYLAVIARNTGCQCYRVGGVADHVHLAVRLSRTVTPANLMMELKSGSSRWLKSQGPKFNTFAWQRGYGAFSVGPTNLEALRKYIETQEEHHQQQSFQDEYRGLLRRCGIDYDERYVWD